ncbi:MAG: lysine--tRNA ligase, partial [Spirochaetaceae bacterium]|nr:lysine--tRNA ligase [Spirochaetaceae bacterium]
LVVRALRDRGKNVRFIYSWDDYDVFRKVPLNMPKPEELENYLRFPITMVPDTFGRDENYARHQERDIEMTLPIVGIEPEFLYQSQRYQAGLYGEGMRKALENRDKLKEILNRYRDDAHKMEGEYWPIAAFCDNCHKDTTDIEGWDGEWGVTYHCTSCDHRATEDLRTSQGIKLGWRVDWPMRWEYEKTVFEPAGKDHHSQGGSFDTARHVSEEVYGWPAPVSFRYDFIGTKGLPGKMSSSSGKVIGLTEVLEIYQPEIVRYLFAGTRPNTEFSISFDLDVIKIYEDYDKTERIAWGVEKAKKEEIFEKEKRIYELSQIGAMPERMPYQIPFRHLCNLLQTNSGDIDAVVNALGDVGEDREPRFRTRCACAWNWITECAPEDFRFALRKSGEEPANLGDTELNGIRKICAEVLPVMDELEEKPLSERIYAVASDVGLEPKALFTAVYQALIGKDQGPRLASFMKIIGKERLEVLLSPYTE